MQKNDFTTIDLTKGQVRVYERDGLKLHAYQTRDLIDDEVFVVEKDGRGFIDRGFSLVLTSHYTPEGLKDAQTKIDYLENLKNIAANSADAAAFKTAVEEAYPAYASQNYLDMTTGFFFPEG